MGKRILLKEVKATEKKAEKSCRNSFFGLNFGIANHLHDVMHGKDGINGEVNSGSTSQPVIVAKE